MGKNKHQHFAENKVFRHVIEPTNEEAIKRDSKLPGQWHAFFDNDHPIVLELGCGKGEYTVGLASIYPEKNFIGVDIKGARIWRGAKTIEENNLKNAAFLRTKIEFISSFFAPQEIDEIWLTFSDPHLKDRREKHRLTHPRFLDIYRELLSVNGLIHLKTDSRFLADYTLGVLADQSIVPHFCSHDIYGADWNTLTNEEQKILGIKTFYEEKFLKKGADINYIRFSI